MTSEYEYMSAWQYFLQHLHFGVSLVSVEKVEEDATDDTAVAVEDAEANANAAVVDILKQNTCR